MRSMRAFLMTKREVFLGRHWHCGIVEDKAGEWLATVELVDKLSSTKTTLEEAVLREWREHISNITSSDKNNERGENEDEEV